MYLLFQFLEAIVNNFSCLRVGNGIQLSYSNIGFWLVSVHSRSFSSSSKLRREIELEQTDISGALAGDQTSLLVPSALNVFTRLVDH